MVLHTCDICNFSSLYTTNYRSHCLSRKHLRNIETMENDKNKKKENQLKDNAEITQDNAEITQDNAEITQQNLGFDKLICDFCGKKYTRIDIKTRHLKTCKIKKKYDEAENQNKIKDKDKELNDKIKKLEEENEKLKNKSTINSTTNNIQINTNNYIKNDKVLNFLNSNYGEAIEMDSFINKIKNDTFLSPEMMDCFVACYNNGGTDSFGSTLVKYLNQICKQFNINIFPLCCCDSNLRSHKEKNSVGWETVIDTKKIEEIIHNIVNDIFMEKGQMIYLDSRDRKKICNIVKKSYGLSNLKMIDDFSENNKIYIPFEE